MCVGTSNLFIKSDLIVLKAEVDKLDFNRLINIPAGLNNLKANVDNVGVGKLKTVPIDLKKFSDVVSKEVDKNTKC